MSAALNPFVGLRPFEEDDAILFFGRSDQVDELLARLNRSRFVAVLGSSGSGKSSLVRAGLIPALRGGFLVEDRDAWDVVTMKPGQRPLVALAAELLRLLASDAHASPFGPVADADVEAVAHRIGHSGADAVAELVLPRLQDRRNLLLVVDQFEELFRFDLQASEAGGSFVEALLDLASRDELPVYVVLTMRSDFLGECDAFLGLTEAMNRGQYLVPKLTRQRRREAIEGPARVGRQRISACLLDRLLNESEDEPDQLPILQHVLMRTWTAAQRAAGNGHVLEVEHYEAVGGMAGALERDAESALPRDPERQALAVQILRALTVSDGANRQLRRPGHISELAAVTGASAAAVSEVIAPFCSEERSFLTVTRAAGSAPVPAGVDDPLIDISHESLIRRWRRLGGWVQAEAESAKVYHRLVDTARLWAQHKEEPLSGVGLRQMDHWWATQRPTLAWALRHGTESDFDQAKALLAESRESERIREAEAGVARAQQHELARTQAVAKTRTKYIALLAVAFLAVVGAAVQLGASKARLKGYENAWVSLDQALTDPRAGLLRAARTLRKNPDLVAAEQAVLDQLTRFGGSRIVADLSVAGEQSRGTQRLFLDEDGGRVLVLQKAGGHAFVSASPAQLLAGWAAAAEPDGNSSWPKVLDAPGIDRLVASTLDGGCLALVTSDGRLDVWQRNSQTGLYEEDPSTGLTRPFTATALTADCHWLAVGRADGTLQLRDLRSGRTVTERVGDDAVARIVSGRRGWLAASTASGALALWRVSSSGWRRSPESIGQASAAAGDEAAAGAPAARATALGFSVDGRRFLVGDDHGDVTLFDLPEAADDLVRMRPRHVGHRLDSRDEQRNHVVGAVSEARDGQLLVVSLLNGELLLYVHGPRGWDEPLPLQGYGPSRAEQVRVGPDGGWLVVRNQDGSAYLWELPADVHRLNSSSARALRGHRGGEITDVRFSGDGRWLVTAGADGVIHRFDLHAPDPTDSTVAYRPLQGAPSAMALSGDARWIATGTSDGAVRVAPLVAAFGPAAREGRSACRETCRGDRCASSHLRVSGNHRWLACGYADETLWLEPLEGGAAAIPVEQGIATADFSPDSRWLVVGRTDGSIAVHDTAVASGPSAPREPVWAVGAPEPGSAPRHVLLVPESHLLASATQSGSLYVWILPPDGGPVAPDAAQRLLPGTTSSEPTPLRSLKASADGAWLAALDEQGVASVWHRTGDDGFGSPVLRSDGSRNTTALSIGFVRRSETSDKLALALVSGATDGAVCVLPLDGLAPLRDGSPSGDLCGGVEPLRTFGTGTQALSISPDGRRILAHGRDGRVRLFDVRRHDPFALIVGGRRQTEVSILDARFTEDGLGVLTFSSNGLVRSLRVGQDDLQAQVAAVTGPVTNK